MSKIILFSIFLGGLVAVSTFKVDSSLVATINRNQVANILITFAGSNRDVVNLIENQSFNSRVERLNTLKSALQAHALRSQENVQSFLNSKSVTYKSFWISNQISIRNANKELLEEIELFPEIEEITEVGTISIDEPKSLPERKPTPLAEWGIERIQAPEAWKITNGTGIVIGSIDTGVRHTHETLRDRYRDPYGWFDPTASSWPVPIDMSGHGTHTLGTALGSNGIGVAPGAQWMACRSCGDFLCERDDLIECGQWMLCPSKPDGTEPDCSKAPSIVTCSWGASGTYTWYEAVTEAWIAAGIIPVFSIGNYGPNCGETGSPGDNRRVIGVGSIDSRSVVARTSSVGPSGDGRIKPELTAPGESVRSAISDDDVSYGFKSGTSMACPHVSGVTALLLSINPNLTFGQVRQALIDGVDRNITSCTCICDNIEDTVFPNFHFGYGVINALKVVENAVSSRNQQSS